MRLHPQMGTEHPKAPSDEGRVSNTIRTRPNGRNRRVSVLPALEIAPLFLRAVALNPIQLRPFGSLEFSRHRVRQRKRDEGGIQGRIPTEDDAAMAYPMP